MSKRNPNPQRTLLFYFDENGKIVAVYLGAYTDMEEAKLRALADKMIQAIGKEAMGKRNPNPQPTLLFCFDENWKIVSVCPGANTDREEAKLRVLADKMIQAIGKE